MNTSLVRTSGRILKWLYYPARRGGGLLKGGPGSKSFIYRSASSLGLNEPVGLTHRRGVLYHEVPFPGLRLEYSRSDLRERVATLRDSIKIEGQRGLDLGCADGGLTFSLQKHGAQMTGVERDKPSFDLALALEARYRTGAQFENTDIVSYVAENMGGGGDYPFDFVLFFSALNWVVEGMTVQEFESFLGSLSKLSPIFVMDSALGGKGQENLSRLGIYEEDSFVSVLKKGLGVSQVEKIGSYEEWYSRGIYLLKA